MGDRARGCDGQRLDAEHERAIFGGERGVGLIGDGEVGGSVEFVDHRGFRV